MLLFGALGFCDRLRARAAPAGRARRDAHRARPRTACSRSARTSAATSSCSPRPARRRSTEAQAPQLFNVVRELAIAANIPMPKVYVIDDTAPNAFATGRDPKHASIAITTGPAREARPRGAPGRHRPRALPRPQLRHPVLAARRRARRLDRPAGRLLPALHVLGRRRGRSRGSDARAAAAGSRRSCSWSRSSWRSSPRSPRGSSSWRSAASASTSPTRRRSS